MSGLVLSLILSLVSGSDWPAFRGPDYNGIASAPDVFQQGFGLETRWEKKLGSAYSGISIAGDRAVTMFSDGKHDILAALSTEDGAELWRFTISETYKGHDGSHDGPLSTPIINDGLVYAVGPFGRLFALRLTDGKLVWERDMVEDLEAERPGFGLTSSPLAVGKVLVVTTGGKDAPAALTGLDKKTGKTLWTAGKARTTYQTPIHARFMGKQQLILVANKQLMGVDPTDGKLLWAYEHGGNNHGGQAVVVGKDRIYVESSYDQGMMLQAKKVDGEVRFEQLWANNQLTRNYNVPVYHKGHLYGFGGRFLTCVNAETGERVWRSRPPGSGFAILIDDHLAIYTRNGSLHLVEATPTGYVEKSSLEILPGDHYTAPSFAGNKLFLRNLEGIAAVDVGKSDVSLVDRGETGGILPNSRFAARMAQIAEASDKRAAVDAFMKEQSRFPILEGERMVHIIYRGKAEDIAVTGQIVDDQKPMNQVPDTDLYYYSLELEAGTHAYYRLSIDFETVTDPLNPAQGPAFYRDELHSIVAVNSWRDGDHLSEPKKPGTLEELTFDSKHTEIERKVQVYLPPGYADSEKRYPVLYVSLGKHAIEKGLLPNTLSNLINAGQIEEVIAVFVEQHGELGYRESRPNYADAYAAMLREELVPLVDKTWRTRAQADDRALLGHYDMVHNTLYAALDGKRTFSRVVVQSPDVDDDARKGLMDLKRFNDVSVRLEWGTYPPKYDARADVPGWSRKLVEGLKARGVNVEGQQQPMGYDWGNWRTRHDDILKLLYPPRRS